MLEFLAPFLAVEDILDAEATGYEWFTTGRASVVEVLEYKFVFVTVDEGEEGAFKVCSDGSVETVWLEMGKAKAW